VPTRFYLSNSLATQATATDASWENFQTPPIIRRVLSAVKLGTRFETFLVGKGTASTTYDAGIAQFISEPVTTQTISGNVKGIIRAVENGAGNDMRAQLLIRVVQSDGVTFRGTLLAHDVSALTSEFATTLTNRKFPLAWAGSGAALTPVNAEIGDRIVVEVGWRGHSASVGVTGSVEIGDSSATDLAEDETGTIQDNPWIEFDGTITFATNLSRRPGPGTDNLTQLGADRSSAQSRGESYALLGSTLGNMDVQSVPYVRPRGLLVESGGTQQLYPRGTYHGYDTGAFLGQTSDSLRIPQGGGGFPSGSSAVEKFKMRALANPGPGYVTWVVSDTPDLTGAQAPAAIQPGTAVVSDQWTEV
jgi:hypothetical protein